MGRKIQGAALRAKKRAQEASHELLEATATEVETGHVVRKTDDQLFVLDTTAETVPGGVQKEVNQKKRKKGLTAAEQKQVDELLQKHDVDALKKMAEETKHQIGRAKRQKRLASRPSEDLWGGPSETLQKESKLTPVVSPGIGDSLAGTAPAHVSVKQRAAKKLNKKVLALQVAHGGQSYHPDKAQHQDMVGEALALELRRNEVTTYNATPLSSGMSETTKALLLGSDDENDEDSDDEDRNAVSDGAIEIRKRKGKLTKAERNRLKRHRAAEKEIDERKKAKQLVNSLTEIKRVKKEFNRKEVEDRERKALVQKLKEESERTLGKQVLQNLSQRDPVGVPALPVALTTELRSSLRSIKPKGTLLEDRLESFRDRKMATHKHVGDRKKVVQGRKRKVKVKGAVEHRLQTSDGADILFMG